MKQLREFFSLVFKPVKKNGVFFFFMYLLGVLCAWCTLPDTPKAHLYSNLYLELFFDLYLLCLLLTLIPQKVRAVIRGALCVVFYLVSLADVFCFVKYGSTLNPSMLLLVGETNSREASEFLATVLTPEILSTAVVWLLLLMALHIVSLFVLKKYRSAFSVKSLWIQPLAGVLGLFLFVWSGISSAHNKYECWRLMTAKSVGKVEHLLTEKGHGEMYTPFSRFLFSVRSNELASQQVATLEKAAQKVVVDSCKYTSPNIVLVIGESVSKYHSSLYGYRLPTTPKQKQREKAGELVKFSDVVSCWNLTSYVFKNMFSMHVVGEKGEWSDYPLFPELFRKAGYHVTFLTNQFLPQAKAAVFDFSGGFFLNNPTLSAAQFDTRNSSLHKFDEDLLADYDTLKKQNTNYNLTIFHLIGQHVEYNKRYPLNRKRFTYEDYTDFRPELTKKRQMILADYDNATVYNDSILNQILKRFEDQNAIVVYVPDHGEECYEGNRGFYCRNHSGKIDYDLARYEFEIPFWIWASRSYRRTHPDLWNAILSAKDKPFMTDALPHLLLYLAGISAPDYHAEYNLLSPSYDVNRPRILKGSTDYNHLKPAT